MNDKNSIVVVCPCCEARLTVDTGTGDVLLHEAAVKKPSIDLSNIKGKFKEEARHREETYQKSIDAEKRKSETIRKRFNEALKKVKENPAEAPPVRDIDL